MGTVQIETDATEGSSSTDVSVAMTVGDVTLGDAGPTIVRVLSEDGSQVVAEVTTDAAQGYAYTTPLVEPGTYIVVAGTVTPAFVTSKMRAASSRSRSPLRTPSRASQT